MPQAIFTTVKARPRLKGSALRRLRARRGANRAPLGKQIIYLGSVAMFYNSEKLLLQTEISFNDGTVSCRQRASGGTI